MDDPSRFCAAHLWRARCITKGARRVRRGARGNLPGATWARRRAPTLLEERYGKKSTIITTNLEYDEWYAFLGQKEMVAALLDRLRHRCYTIRISGESLRTPLIDA